MEIKINPKFDLVLERIVEVPLELVWKAWTEAEHIVKWFCPKPYEVYHCEVDLRAGGVFITDMKGPEMPETKCRGCVLEVVKERKFVWTSAMTENFRPVINSDNPHDIQFTCYILLESIGEKTKYTAIAIHPDEVSCKKHADMGFIDGWGTCLDQLVEEIKRGNIK